MDGGKSTGKRQSADFKAKVALEAIRGDLTLAELGTKHGIHHTMIAAWKRQAIDGMASTFVRRQDIWLRSRRRLAEDRPRLSVDRRPRARGGASADIRW